MYDQAAVKDLQWAGKDIDGANALLDEAGIVDSDGDGWREGPDGAPLELRMAGTATLNDRRLHEVWKRSLDAVATRYQLRDLWAGKDLGVSGAAIKRELPAQDVFMLRLKAPH
jgi:hypothetical protein